MNEFLISILSGTIGGLLVFYYQKFDEKNKAKNIIARKITSDRTIVPKDIIYHIEIGTSMEKIKDFFGNPKFSTEINEDELYKNGLIFTINLYVFEECEIKIFHSHNSVKGLILKPYVDGKFEFERYDAETDNLFLGEYLVDDSFSEPEQIEYSFSMANSWFGIIEYYGRIGKFNDYCYYGECDYFQDGPKINDLKGAIISGYGVASDKTYFKYYE